jgi:pimeloyl-ACP methyl ester carboxylesterase
MMRRALLVCGALSSVLYLLGIDIVAALLYPDYHRYTSQMVSELIARGAPTRTLMIGLLVPYNLLVLAFAGGVWASAAGKRATRLTAAALLAYGATSSVGLTLAPMDLRVAGLTEQTVLHIWVTVLQGVFIVLVLVAGAFAHGARFRRYSFATLALTLVFGGWAGAQAVHDSPWLGLTERVNIYAWMLWLLVLAISLWNSGADVFAGATRTAISRDGTRIGYLSIGCGPSVVVVPGVLSMAADYAAFAHALAERFTVHTIERRGRGVSGPQGADYSIVKECEDVLALKAETGASLLVGHSYGGLVALEVARNASAFTKVAVYEPGVSIDGSMPTSWMPGYEKKLAANRSVDAFVEFILADAPPRIQKIPPWLMKLMVLLLVSTSRQYRQMLGLLHENLREWREIARLDGGYERYRDITAGVLLMYGGRSDSAAVSLSMERLASVLPHSETKAFPRLDHFGIERTAPREVAKVVGDYFCGAARIRAPALARPVGHDAR